jgi:hypothetical protein
MKIVVCVPIYKSFPNWYEIISFNQCVSVLHRHKITIVTFEDINLDYYTKILDTNKNNYSIRTFNNEFFESVEGYNRLLLSTLFYKGFVEYEYLFIHQLDAYVFEDRLVEWCSLGLDFIGAPLIEDKYGVENKYFLNDFNGGFSLRKIEYCIKLLSYKGPIIKPSKVYEITKKEFNTSFLKTIVYTLFRSFGRQNNIKYFINKNYINEDLLFTLGLHISWINSHINENESWIFPKLPNISTAINFAFERYPAYLFELNNNELPFGCHAWEKYEYETFWRKYIVAK